MCAQWPGARSGRISITTRPAGTSRYRVYSRAAAMAGVLELLRDATLTANLSVVTPGLDPGSIDGHGSSPWAEGPRVKPGHDDKTSSYRAAAVIPAAFTEAVEIGWDDRLDRGGGNAERFQIKGPGGNDIVALEHFDLVGSQRRLGQQRHQTRLHTRQPERQVDKAPVTLDLGQQQLHQLAEGVDLGAAELVGAPGGCRVVENVHRRAGDIADINRLEPG